jgi:hypothetical protein
MKTSRFEPVKTSLDGGGNGLLDVRSLSRGEAFLWMMHLCHQAEADLDGLPDI